MSAAGLFVQGLPAGANLRRQQSSQWQLAQHAGCCQRCRVRPLSALKDDTESSHVASLEAMAAKIASEDPATKQGLDRVSKAAARVTALQDMQTKMRNQLAGATSSRATAAEERREERDQAQRASERGATADVIAAAEELQRAVQQAQEAEGEQRRWRRAINEDAERTESGRAAGIAAAAGAVANLPYLVASGSNGLQSGALSLLGAAVTCLLFGVCYRYAVRQDLHNTQLKGGVVAAFGLARGIAQADTLQHLAAEQGTSAFSAAVLGPAALMVGESMLTVFAAAAAIELAYRRELLKPFGTIE